MLRQTEVWIDRLDGDSLKELSRRTDKLGVLSIYVDADPSQDPNVKAIDLKNRFRELQRRVTDGAAPEQGRSLVAALERVWPQIESLTSPVASGRSRILFAALDGDWVLRFESAMPLVNRMVLDDGPFIHPLLEMLDEGRAAGVVLVSADEAQLYEWRLGRLAMLRRMERQYVEAPHERAGQLGGGPEGQFHTPKREQRQARERNHVQRFLDDVVAVAVELAGDRGWERILVGGGERWTETVVAKFPKAISAEIFGDPRVLNGLNGNGLSAAVTRWAHEQHAECQQRLVGHVLAVAGAGRAALGLSEVAAALNDRRVAHLVYDPQVRYTGTVGANGALYGGDEVGPDGHPGRPEPRLTERLVERALETGAGISPVDGAADGRLRDATGVAALLRW